MEMTHDNKQHSFQVFDVSSTTYGSNIDTTLTVDDVVNRIGFGKFQIQLLFLAGLGWIADSCEIFILSVIGDYVACDFNLFQWQVAFLTSMVFFGMMVGSPLFGTLADIYGRKKALAVSMVLLFVFGASSAASPSYTWMVILRSLMGVALGGATQGLTLCSEYCPAKRRGRYGINLCYFWSVGTVGVVLLSWVIMVYLNNWRILLVAASAPAFLVVLSLKWYPESPRFYLVNDQYEEAVNMLAKMAAVNNTEMPSGSLKNIPSGTRKGQIKQLFDKQHRQATIFLWYICFAAAFTYYGVCLISPYIIKNGSLNTSLMQNSTSKFTDHVLCKDYNSDEFIELLWTSAAEFPGILLFALLIERIDRKLLLGSSCIVCGFLVVLLLLSVSKTILLVILFASRSLAVAVFQLIIIILSEVYPTTVRALGVGAGMAFCRLGGLVVPYLAQVFVVVYPVAAMIVLGAVIIIAGIAAALLPIETRGAYLKESD